MVIYRFDNFELDEGSMKLSESGQQVELSIQSARILAALLKEPGKTVSHRELACRFWRDRNVNTRQSIHTAIAGIRKAIGDDPRESRYIRTEHRDGYTFIAPVHVAARQKQKWPWPRGNLVTAVLTTFIAVTFVGIGLFRLVAINSENSLSFIDNNLHEDHEIVPNTFLESFELASDGMYEDAYTRFQNMRVSRPESALSLVGIGYTRLQEAFNDAVNIGLARDVLLEALSLNPKSPYANAVYARYLSFYEHDFPSANAYVDAALRSNFKNPEAHIVKAYIEMAEGRLETAVEYAELASLYEPESANRMAELGVFYGRARRFEESRATCLNSLAINSDSQFALVCLLFANWRLGNFEDAKQNAVRLLTFRGIPEYRISQIELMSGREAISAFWATIIDYYHRSPAVRDVRDLNLAVAYASIGDVDSAVEHLRSAMSDERAKPYVLLLGVDPHIDSIRTAPNFLELKSEILQKTNR